MPSGNDHDPSDHDDERDDAPAPDRELGAVVDALPSSLVRYDRTGRITYVNREFERGTDRCSAEVIGRRPFEWADGEDLVPDRHEYRRLLDEVLATGEPRHLDRVRSLPDGGVEMLQVLFRPETDEAGDVVGAFALARNVTDVARLRELLDAREHEFRSLAENMPDVVIRYDADGRVTYTNRQYDLQIGGRPLIGLPLDETVPPTGSGAGYRDCIRRVLATGVPGHIEMTIPGADGEPRVHSVLAQPELDASDRVVGVIAIGHDVTDLIEAQRDIERREREFRTLAENLPDIVVRYGTDARVAYLNRTVGIPGAPTVDQLMGTTPTDAAHPHMPGLDEYERRLRQVIATGEPSSIEMRFTVPGVPDVVHSVLFHAERADDGRIVGAIAIARDITEVVRQREALEHAARTDSLTGVASRQVLYEQVPQMLDHAHAAGGQVALMLVDLDGFKHINDQYGHRLGDHILRQVGARLRSCLGSDDLLVRLGGDEFVIALAGIETPTDASLIAHQTRLALAELDPGDDIRLPPIDASVGIAVFPHHGSNVDQLLAHADLALYDAKRTGRGRVEFYRPELRTALERRTAIEEALRRCTPDTEMTLHLQPICTLDDDPRAWGAEALLRWHHPTLGRIAPDEFIPIAEQSGQIVPIGRWVLRRAAEFAVLLNADRAEPLRIAVNVSTRQFTLDDVGDAVRETLRLTGCDPRWLILELTESLLLEEEPLVHAAIEQIRQSGVSIAIDDFGTGYSALHYLTRLRIDHMKVDKMFVRDADVDPQQLEIVRAIVALAHALDVGVVAEGIETCGQAALLRQLGCALGQGYLLARPMPLEEFQAWLAAAAANLRSALPA